MLKHATGTSTINATFAAGLNSSTLRPRTKCQQQTPNTTAAPQVRPARIVWTKAYIAQRLESRGRHAGQHRLAVLDLVADRILHERVRDQDEVGGKPGAGHRDPQRGEMQAWRELVPPEDPQPQERRLQEEGRQALDRERRAEHVADELRVDRPVHAELELLDETGRDADREVDQKQRAEEVRQPKPRLVTRPPPQRLEDRDDRAQSKRQRYEQEVIEAGRRKLGPRQIDGRGRDEDHERTFEHGPPRRIIQTERNPRPAIGRRSTHRSRPDRIPPRRQNGGRRLRPCVVPRRRVP